jgi:hypothetical protein
METGAKWVTPYYFTKRQRAVEEAKFWDSFFEKKYDEISVRIWKAEIISSKKRSGIPKKPLKTSQKKKMLTRPKYSKKDLPNKA